MPGEVPEGSMTKAKEAENFAFLITDVVIPDGMGRVGVVGYLAAAGIYCHEGDMAYGTDESDSRNGRMLLKVVGHLGDSDHKYNPMALSQLAAAWSSSRTVSVELGEIGAYSYNEGGQLMANVSVLHFERIRREVSPRQLGIETCHYRRRTDRRECKSGWLIQNCT